jgi:hypothetical protein
MEGLEARSLLSLPPLFTHTTHKLSVPRGEPNVVTVGDLVLISYGTDNVVDVYDAATKHWSTTSPPQQVKLGEFGELPMVIGRKVVYTAGTPGDTSQAFLEIYDASSGQWSSTPAPDEVKRINTAVTIGSKVIFAGGVVFGGQTMAAINYDQVAIFDVATDQWSSATLSSARVPEVAVVGNKVIFAGGYFAVQGEPYSAGAVDIYDADTGQWSSTTLSSERQGISVAVVGNKALFAGGFHLTLNGGVGSDSANVDIYDGATGAWSTAQLSQPRQGPSVAIIGGKAIFAGADYGPNDAADVYDSASGTWSSAKLSHERALPAVAVAGGRAFFAGTTNGDLISKREAAAASKTVDVYNSATGQWSAAKLSASRQPQVAAAGNLVFFASSGSTPTSRAVDVLDVATGKWSTTRLGQARSGEAPAEAGGQVLFIGGYRGIQKPSNFVDVFIPMPTGAATSPHVAAGPGAHPHSTAPTPVHAWPRGGDQR